MSRSRVTIPDLAKELGLSIGTVSNALNGKGRVAESTRQRVLDAARRMGYSRNRVAAALRSGRHGAVSVHLPAQTGEFTFYMEFTFGLSTALAEHGVDLLVAAPVGGNDNRLVDGCVVVDWAATAGNRDALSDTGIPLLAVEGVADDSITPTATLAVDYTSRIEEIILGARASGATKVSLITREWARDTAWLEGVLAAYETTCAEAGQQPHCYEFPAFGTPDELVSLLQQVDEDSAPDCLIFGSQRLAGIAGAMLGYGRQDSRVPWIASSVADPISELRSDSITCIDVDAREFGRRAATLLLELIEDTEGGLTGERFDWPVEIKWGSHWTPVAARPVPSTSA